MIIYNRDKNLAAFTEQLFDDTCYNKQVCDLKHKGHEFNCQTYDISARKRFEDDVTNRGYEIVSLEEVFDTDLDEDTG